MDINDEQNFSGDMLIYQNEKGNTKVDVYFRDDTVWMTQKNIAQMYQTTPQNVTLHIKNIFLDGELEKDSTCKEFLQVQIEGSRTIQRTVKIYNLQMILAVGYRIRSNVGNQFRNWASGIISEYMKKGFAMNDDRLKNPKSFGADYFDELLERIRDIRASEQRFYNKIKEIFATSIDYNSKSEQAKLFFKTVQNKLHYAAHGHTASELIAKRADAFKPNMGLTSFAGKRVRKQDIVIAKNYLNPKEIDILNRIVVMYLDYAELQAKNSRPMYMKNWEEKLDEFLKFNGREVLDNPGEVSHEIAEKLASKQYDLYGRQQKLNETTDIDQILEDVQNLKNN